MTPEQQAAIRRAQQRLALDRAQARMAEARSTSQSPDPIATGQPPEGFFLNPETGQMTSRELLRGNAPSSALGAGVRGFAQGAAAGFADELKGVITPGTEEDKNFARERARAQLEADTEQHPWIATGSRIGGAVALPAVNVAKGPLAAQALKGAAAGGVVGGTYGFGEAEGAPRERLDEARTGAAIGAVAGAAAPYALAGGSRLIQGRANRRAVDEAISGAPAPSELRSQADDLYKSVAQRGVTVKGASLDPLVDDIVATARELGVDRTLTPDSAAALRRITQSRGKDITLKDLDILRRIASNASTAQRPQDRMIGGAIVERVDDFVANLMDSDVTAGNVAGLGDDLTKARDLWKRLRNSEKLGAAIEAAKDQASGLENGIRIQFRQIVSNPKKRKGFSEGEIEAMREVVRGTPTGNLLRRMSRLSFGSGAQTNFLGASVGLGASASVGSALGGSVGGAIGAVAAPLIGKAAQIGAERSTLRAAQRAQALSAAGGLSALPVPAGLNALENVMRRVPGAASAGYLGTR